MSLFSPADFPEQRGTATLYRSPAAGTAGTFGGRVLSGTVDGVFVPARQFSAQTLSAAPEGLGGVRYDQAVIVQGVALRIGDELRGTVVGGTARVQTVDNWGGAQVAFVEQVR